MSDTGNIEQLGVKALICEDKKYLIPDYQRGYRWRDSEVTKLLDDIAAISDSATTYCLQPIVVKDIGGKYELIDGQQRLTTLYLICKCLNSKLNKGVLESHPENRWKPCCEIEYQTRKESWKFLDKIDTTSDASNDNADYYFMKRAYDIINEYKQLDNVCKNLCKVKVIWYVTDEKDGYELFKRLNSYRIALTDAELIRALFLKKGQKDIDENRQFEMATEWDQMERELRDSSFWHFLTRNKPSDYTSRLELIFCLMDGKEKAKNHDVFNDFEKSITENPYDLWQRVCNCYTTLRSWYKDHKLYHLIGYLVASGHTTMQTIVQKFIPEYLLNSTEGNKTQAELHKKADEWVKASLESLKSCVIQDEENNQKESNLDSLSKLDMLSYENKEHKKIINRILLLFNVVYYMDGSGKTHRFPFDSYIADNWSLEHIHPQKPVDLHKKMKTWWKDHKHLYNEDLLRNFHSDFDKEEKERIEKLVCRLENEEYAEIAKDGEEDANLLFKFIMNRGGHIQERHGLNNLVLLQKEINSSLQNHDFSLKCHQLLEEDAKGTYLPPCTRNAFLKYYTIWNPKLNEDDNANEENKDTDTSNDNMEFWTAIDRTRYIKGIKKALNNFLPQ